MKYMLTGWKPSERFRHFLNMFLGVGWGGLGWGNNVHVLAHNRDVTPRHVHLHVRTYVMLRWRCVTSRRAGVGWGNNVHVLAHSHDVTPRHVHLHVRTYVMLRWRCVTSRRAGVGWVGVGWGNNVHVLAHSHRKIQFIKKIRRHAGKTFWVHTGTIHSCWRMIKASVPDQLTSCPENEQKLKGLIWTYVRTWQWRWEANVVGKALLEKTGAYLAKM